MKRPVRVLTEVHLLLQFPEERVEVLVPSDGLVVPDVIPVLVDAVLFCRAAESVLSQRDEQIGCQPEVVWHRG